MNKTSGELTIRQNTPAGSYWLKVGVSDGVWPDVVSGVRVHVRELEEKALLSAASLRLTGKTCTFLFIFNLLRWEDAAAGFISRVLT